MDDKENKIAELTEKELETVVGGTQSETDELIGLLQQAGVWQENPSLTPEKALQRQLFLLFNITASPRSGSQSNSYIMGPCRISHEDLVLHIKSVYNLPLN